MVGLVFAMQGAGLVVGPLLASALLLAHVPNAVTWRLLLAFGAVPALLVFSWRRKIHETPRFSEAQGNEKAVSAAIKNAVEVSPASPPSEMGAVQVNPESDAVQGMGDLLKNKRLLVWLLGTASTWALLDFAYYGNTISSPEVLKLVNPNGTLVKNTLVQLAIFVVFALPGYWLAVRYLDRLGRKSIQLIGFFMMAVVFLLIGLVTAATTVAIPFVLLFGRSYFFSEFGPNTTTFVFPSEIFPVRVRTTADGISAAAGKFGGFLGAFIFPIFLASTLGLRGTEVITGAVCVVGFIVTLVLLPEPKGLTLEQIEFLAEQR
jgi:MFS family permease